MTVDDMALACVQCHHCGASHALLDLVSVLAYSRAAVCGECGVSISEADVNRSLEAQAAQAAREEQHDLERMGADFQ